MSPEKGKPPEGGNPGQGPQQSEVYREMMMTETLESIETVEAPQPKRPIGPIIWETILQMENDGRLITRRNLREVTGLSYEQIDESIKRLETQGKVIKAGGGLIEVVPLYPAERAQSLVALPDGRVKWELADGGATAGGVEAVLTPPEARRIGMLFAGFARQFEEMEISNKALMRTAELAQEVRQLKRELAALKQPKNEAQMDLLSPS
jgi:biotin operon repressor